MTWGVDSHIFERFGQAGVAKEKISLDKDTFYFDSADKSPVQLVEMFRRFYGPTMNAFEAAEKNGKVDELHSQLAELAKAQNRSTNGSTSIPATFLRVTVLV
jgi:hypothetical protein